MWERMAGRGPRSAEVHSKSLDEITKTMTQPKALEVLRKDSLVNTSTLTRVTGLLTGSQHLRKRGYLRKSWSCPVPSAL